MHAPPHEHPDSAGSSAPARTMMMTNNTNEPSSESLQPLSGSQNNLGESPSHPRFTVPSPASTIPQSTSNPHPSSSQHSFSSLPHNHVHSSTILSSNPTLSPGTGATGISYQSGTSMNTTSSSVLTSFTSNCRRHRVNGRTSTSDDGSQSSYESASSSDMSENEQNHKPASHPLTLATTKAKNSSATTTMATGRASSLGSHQHVYNHDRSPSEFLPTPTRHHPASQHQLTSFLSSLFPYHATRALAYAKLFEVVLPYVAKPFIGAILDVPTLPVVEQADAASTSSTSSSSATPSTPSSVGSFDGSSVIYGHDKEKKKKKQHKPRLLPGGRTVYVHFKPVLPPIPTTTNNRRPSTSRSPSASASTSIQHPPSSSSSWSVSGPELHDPRSSTHHADDRYQNKDVDIRDHLTSLLDLVMDQLEATEVVLVLDRKERKDDELRELLHALAYVGGTVLKKGSVLGGFEWDDTEWILVGLEV